MHFSCGGQEKQPNHWSSVIHDAYSQLSSQICSDLLEAQGCCFVLYHRCNRWLGIKTTTSWTGWCQGKEAMGKRGSFNSAQFCLWLDSSAYAFKDNTLCWLKSVQKVFTGKKSVPYKCVLCTRASCGLEQLHFWELHEFCCPLDLVHVLSEAA